jgi:hypothetical protein
VVREAGKREPVLVQMDRSNGECLVFAAVAGRHYSIESKSPVGSTAERLETIPRHKHEPVQHREKNQ